MTSFMHDYHGEGPGRIDKNERVKVGLKPMSCEGSKLLAFLDVYILPIILIMVNGLALRQILKHYDY